MGYRVIENEKLFEVVEHRTETKEQYTIRRFNTKDDAKKFSKHLNLGGGFDGWTPHFFLKTIKEPVY